MHACTAAEEELIMHFHHDQGDEPTTFAWADLKPGACIAVLYAYNKRMMDMSSGVRVESLTSVFVFKAPLESLLKASDQLLQDATSPQCFADGCEAGGNTLQRYSRCRLAGYCGKEHQTADWTAGHKRACFQLDVVKQLMDIEHRPFEGHVNFRFEVEQRPTSQESKACALADNAHFDLMMRVGGIPDSTPCTWCRFNGFAISCQRKRTGPCPSAHPLESCASMLITC